MFLNVKEKVKKRKLCFCKGEKNKNIKDKPDLYQRLQGVFCLAVILNERPKGAICWKLL